MFPVRTRRFAVVTTRGEIDATLRLCLEAIDPQVDGVFLVDNSDDGEVVSRVHELGGFLPRVTALEDPQQPPNISQLWNFGLDCARLNAADNDYHIAVLNDDAIVPPTWFDQIAQAMDRYGCAAGGFGGSFAVHTTPGTTRLDQRLPGFAFVLAGRTGIRADEQFRWWCGDNDIDMQARQAGGTVILPGDPVRHLYPDRSTAERPELRAMTGPDMQRFVDKWGFRPW